MNRAKIPLHAGLIAGARERASIPLAEDLSETGAVRAAHQVEQWADERVRQQLAHDRPKLDCKKGCAWCCFIQVAVRPPEVLAILEYIRRHFTPIQQAALAKRARDVAEQVRGLDALAHERLRLPCPLLVNNACSVYSVRPLACRGFNSTSARACRANYEAPPREVTVYGHQLIVTASISEGLAQALNSFALDDVCLSLPVALDIALSIPDAGERWLSGEAVFVSAETP